jgi:glycosyltransferase involved in cell wall biosynthesis
MNDHHFTNLASDDAERSIRVTLCWTGISGYLVAGWRELQALPGLDVAFRVQLGNRGFDKGILAGLRNFRGIDPAEAMSPSAEAEMVRETRPDVVILSGWTERAHRLMARDRGLADAAFIMAMDTPWTGSFRQHAARFLLRSHLRRMSIVVTACDRSRMYAERLAVPRSRIRVGTYCGDVPAFAPAAAEREGSGHWPRKFLFVGRLIPAKGLDTLAEAYEKYRAGVDDPWSLSIAGTGPLAHLLERRPGVDLLGFVQPAELPRLFAEHGAFVISSRHEPWGVVIAEAAAAGLPIICSDACGAGIDLVRDASNGMVFAADDVAGLASALRSIHDSSAALREYGEISQQLVEPYGPRHWAHRWNGYIHAAAANLR